MRIAKRLALLLLLIILAFVAHVLVSTGFFRTIESTFEGEVLQKIQLKGAEDITISRTDSFALVSATDRGFFPSEEQEEGGLYFIDLTVEPLSPILLTEDFAEPFAPHGISLYKVDSTYRVMAINHTTEGHFIEVFSLNGQRLAHLETLSDPMMVSPNDIVMINERQFYFTNDHKYTDGLPLLIEDYGGLALANVIYYDGDQCQEVYNGIAYANGINIDPNRDLLYVASPRKFLVKVFTIQQGGTLSFVEDIPCGTGVDNIEFDDQGKIWIGAHPNLLRFASYAKGKKETTPSEIITIDYRSKGDYTVETVYLEDGSTMSGATVAATFGDLILVGNVMDEAFLVLKRSNAHLGDAQKDSTPLKLNDLDPISFIDFHCKNYSSQLGIGPSLMGDLSEDWIQPNHLQTLIDLVGNQDSCRCYMNILSSHIPEEHATKGGFASLFLNAYKNKEDLDLGLYACPENDEALNDQLLAWWKDQQGE